MRPTILNPLFAPATAISGVGPRIAKAIERCVGGPLIVHLLWHLPSGLIDRRYAPKLADATPGAIATLTVKVGQHVAPANKRLPYKVHCLDETGAIDLVFFHAREPWLRAQLPEGMVRVVSGRVEQFGDALQMVHPDHIAALEAAESLRAVEPTYPLTAGLHLKSLSRAILGALERAPELPEWLDPAHQRREAWPAWREALRAVHEPESEAALAPDSLPRARLAYDELLANQLALALVRAALRSRGRGRVIKGDGALRAKVSAALPFTLTPSQTAAIDEIEQDLAQEGRMLRLLQGDVGSGKTVVALLTMLVAVEAGGQAAIMAPTEILARQHFETLGALLAGSGVEIALVTGRERAKSREATLARLQSGEVDIAVGTHALFQNDVEFRDLMVAVIDEQHRFGVHQRLMLARKGRGVDVLVMTATPIPRTLTLTAYGDMNVTRLPEKPPGRKPVVTRVLPLERLSEVVEAAKRAVESGAKVYWVCPLVEESEVVDLAAATERHQALQELFGGRVGLVHGRMKGPEKDAAMAAFSGGDTDVLVATTVIEVGVDVPAASVMIVEQAERFGLAQLHQLRGRVGRAGNHSTCLLLYAAPLGETARARLKIMRETDDGFRIAEEDLRLRGAGELLGTRQSGLPQFRVADLAAHGALLATARDDAKLILERDQALESERGKALRTLLYLFERDAAVAYLRSG